MLDPLQQLQLDIAAYLASEASSKLSAFHYVPIITSNARAEGDDMGIVDTINKALAGLTEKNGKSGLTAIVLDPEAGVPMEHMAGPYIEIEQVIRFVENKLINMGSTGTQVPCAQLALDTLSALHKWTPGRMQELRGRDRKAMERIRTDDDNLIIWELNLFSRYQVTPVEATETPVIATAGTLPSVTVTLTCADGGASLFYSTDGSYPSTAYTAPFTVTSAKTVRALAMLTNYLPSAIAEKDIS